MGLSPLGPVDDDASLRCYCGSSAGLPLGGRSRPGAVADDVRQSVRSGEVSRQTARQARKTLVRPRIPLFQVGVVFNPLIAFSTAATNTAALSSPDSTLSLGVGSNV